ncbi:hypothetical protein HOY80DRAFT_982127 [Tuber brumale]|nr:hypothetical protein HOY80DRAFT_982127 [Tuber brumale]
MPNGEAQKKRKAGDIGGTIKDQPAPAKRTKGKDTKKGSLKGGCKKPAKVNITKPAKSTSTRSAEGGEDGGRPAKRLKVTGPIRKSKGDLRDTKTGDSTMTKAKSPTVKDTKGPKIKGSGANLATKDAKVARGTSTKKMRNARSNAEDTNVAQDPPIRGLGLKCVFIGSKELERSAGEGNSSTNRSKRPGPQISKAGLKRTEAQDSIKAQTEVPAVDDTKIAPGTPSKTATSTGPYTRRTGLSTRSMKVGECAPITDFGGQVLLASRAEVKGSPGAEAKISCQPSPPTTSGSRIEKRCPLDPSFSAVFDLPSVPSTPSRIRRSKWENMLPSVRLNTPERSCSPPPSAEFSVEIASPRKMNYSLDRVKALKSESEESFATQGPNLRRSARARRNTIL